MKRKFTCIIAVAVAMTFVGCGNKSAADQARMDSLQTALDKSKAEYRQLDEYLTVISSSLDSIALQESDLYSYGTESPAPNREQIEENLAAFQNTLKNQRERIAQLEQKLNSESGESKKLHAIIVSLKAQLTEKESQITALREELNNKNVSIEHLNQRMTTLKQQNTFQQEVITTQNKMIETQDNIINEGFVKIASKNELKNSGLLTGGLFKKKKVDYSKVDKRQFRSVDTRVMTEIEINSKSPKILTEVPSGSYSLEREGDKTVLRIIDPTRFWNVSKFLIIQI